MATSEDWRISYCAGYVVPPCKHLDHAAAAEQIQGSSVTLSSRVHRYFHPKLVESPQSCTVHIAFTPTEGEQRNDIRDLVRRLAFGDLAEQNEASRELAVHLALASDKRSHRKSPVGLFIVLRGVLNEEVRIVLFKFPADESLQATFAEEGLSISVIEGAFSRGTDFFKAAVFQGNRANTTFWSGQVEDKQASQRVSGVSDLWVIGFLKALPRLTAVEGSRILAKSLRNVAAKIGDPSMQHELIAAATTIKSQSDRNITLREFSENYLSSEIREFFLSELGSPLLADVPFPLDSRTFDEQFGVKTVLLDSQFSVIGPLDAYENLNVYAQSDHDDGTAEITLRGRIISEQLKTTRSLPRG